MSAEKLLDKVAEAKAQQAFMAYVLNNYGPGCVLGNPSWHAPKLFRAALAAIEDARTPYVNAVAWEKMTYDEACKKFNGEGSLIDFLGFVYRRDKEGNIWAAKAPPLISGERP